MLGGTEQTAVRLGAALLIGAILGLNRELHGKPAGLRTHALVSLGAAVATIVALESPMRSMPIDPNAIGRVVQGILTGVGFLGAGVILRDPIGHVTGLTTAATIWMCAVLGIVCGLGYWTLLGVAAVFTTVILLLGRPVERLAERLFKKHVNAPPDHSV
ncbi:MAG: magnesium transporter [Chthoniobacterales bacterium]|nr:MAG: magnesium transporter [Chthoniobacterales bacterium]